MHQLKKKRGKKIRKLYFSYNFEFDKVIKSLIIIQDLYDSFIVCMFLQMTLLLKDAIEISFYYYSVMGKLRKNPRGGPPVFLPFRVVRKKKEASIDRSVIVRYYRTHYRRASHY